MPATAATTARRTPTGSPAARGLSPYEISALYADVAGVHRSTIYRWVEAGCGGLANLELERKVGFKPRERTRPRKPTSRSRKRSHGEFEKLPGGPKGARAELDCAVGRNADEQAVLTLCNLPCRVQPALLLDARDCGSVKRGLANVRAAMPEAMHERWMRVALAGNGEELSDEDGIGALLGERAADGGLEVRLYYCDPRQSQQKGGCEKDHTEIRQLPEKGTFSFDELARAGMAVLVSHVNSNPRESLGGKSPIQMLRFVCGDDDADALLDAFGIREVGRDELTLKPDILDIERAKRGMPPLTRLR